MNRRFGTEKVQHITLDGIVSASGIQQLVAPTANVIIAPRMAVISSHSGGAFEYALLEGSDVFLHSHTPSNDGKQITWPDGFELTVGSGVFINPLSNDGSISFYYTCYDVSPGITKEASRAASLPSGPKAIRRPTNSGDQQEG